MRLLLAAIALSAACTPDGRAGWRADPDCTCVGVDGGTVQVSIIDFVECEVPRAQVVDRCNRWIEPPPSYAGCATAVTCGCTVIPASPLDCND
jgi:hypothetical protein